MYVPPSAGIVWKWSFCCKYKYLITLQYKQALSFITAQKGFGNSVTSRNSSSFVKLLVHYRLSTLSICWLVELDGHQLEVVVLGRTQPASGGDAATGGIRWHDPQSLDEASRTAPRARAAAALLPRGRGRGRGRGLGSRGCGQGKRRRSTEPDDESGAGPEQPLDSEVHGPHTAYNQTAAGVVPQLQDEALHAQHDSGAGSRWLIA